MDTKSDILCLLERDRGKRLSGESIADALGITRAAVWKAVKSLISDGYAINSVRGEGYMLSPLSDTVSEAAIRARLPHRLKDAVVVVKPSAVSTNIDAATLAAGGAPSGSIVVALSQSGGQGRVGKSFASPEGGLYFSVVLRLSSDISTAPLITPAAAVAVSRALEKLSGVSVSIKWVNDLFYGGKKVCGISAQATADFFSSSLRSVIVGVGINYATDPSSFPPELKGVAGTLFPTGAPPVRNDLIAAIATALTAYADDLDPGSFMPEYRRRCFVIGKRVDYVLNNVSESGIAESVADDGALIVKTDGGGQRRLSSGEVSVKINEK